MFYRFSHQSGRKIDGSTLLKDVEGQRDAGGTKDSWRDKDMEGMVK
jgi:hypothetical protein